MKKALFILLASCLDGVAQNTQMMGPDFSIRGNISIPNPVSSKMFATSFAGVIEGNLSLNTRVFSNFYVGIGYQSFMLENDKALKYTYYNASIAYNTKLIGNGGFVRLDYMRFFSAKGYMSYAIQAGYMYAQYTNVNEDSSKANQPFVPTKFTSPYIQPEMSVNFIVDKNLSFSINLSYTTMLARFDPKAPRFNHVEEISSKSNNYFMSWINFGFGFNILLNRKK